MNADKRKATVEAIDFLLDRPGAEAAWSATDQVLGGGAVVTVTVRAVVSREDRLEPWPQRYVLGSGVAPVTWPVAP